MQMFSHFFAVGIVVLATVARFSQGGEAEVVRQLPVEEKLVALTIDDGPYAGMTEKLLAVLQKKNVRATFFILGENAQEYPDLCEKIQQAGHEIGSHSFTHDHLNKMTQEQCANQLDKAESVIGSVSLFRPPGGLYNDGVLQEAKKRNYQLVLWSVDPHDWQKPSAGEVAKRVLQAVKPGSIVLLHDGQSGLQTPQAISEIVDNLRKQGYSFVTVSELLDKGRIVPKL